MSTTAIVKRPVIEALESEKQKILARVPAGIDAERLYLSILTAVQKNPDLLDCEPRSVFLAAYDAADQGCNLSPSLGLGWLIVYKVKRTDGGKEVWIKEAQFQASYRLFIQKAYETGLIRAFNAEVVYSNDVFKRQFAPKRNLIHVPKENQARGEAIGAYALIQWLDGEIDFEYLTKEEIELRRSCSKAPDSMMWSKFTAEAWRKTAIRVLRKRLPLKSPKIEALVEAIGKDEETETLPEPDGRIELASDSPLKDSPKGDPENIAQGPLLTYKVGKKLTVIVGNVTRILPDLKRINGKLNEQTKIWEIPAGMTFDFVDACTKHGIETRESPSEEKVEPHAPNPYDEAPRTMADL